MRHTRAAWLAVLVALAACSSPGRITVDGEELDVDKTKVRERVPRTGYFQLELIATPEADWAPIGTRWWVPKDHASVRISLPDDVQAREYSVGEDCRIEVAPRSTGVHDLFGKKPGWVSATRGAVTIERAGQTLRGSFWADTSAGPVEGEFRVKRRPRTRPEPRPSTSSF